MLAKPLSRRVNAQDGRNGGVSDAMDGATGGMLQRDRDGTVLVLTMAVPPVNALSAPLRAALAAAMDEAAADPAVGAIVIASGLSNFSAGADVTEFDAAPKPPFLPDLCQRIETLEKPVVAALRGAVLGGGLELALAAHARTASEDARLGLPEVALGLLPGAGGTQRLPRLIGAEQALRLMLGGRPVPAAEALALGMLDSVGAGDPVLRAKELARAMAGRTFPRTGDRRDGMRDAQAYMAAVGAARRSVGAGRLPAPARIVDCVEAALLLPLDQGLAYERAAFLDLLASPEAAGLRHAFVAERRAQRLRPEWGPPSARPERLLVWGAGTDAVRTARDALESGMRVTLADTTRDRLVAALNALAAAQEEAVQAGRLSPSARDADWARLTTEVAPQRLDGAEAVILTQAGAPPVAPRLCVLAMTADVPAGALGLALSGTQGSLAEISVSETATPEQAGMAFALARRLRWKAVPTGGHGPVAARMARALAECVAWLEGQGIDRRRIASALSAHGIAGEGKAAPPDPDRDGIARRCLAALANEGARLLDAKAVRIPACVDTIAIGAGIMARHTGGPMYQADRRGLLVLRRDLELWAEEMPALFAPSPLIGACLSKGLGFADLDRA